MSYAVCDVSPLLINKYYYIIYYVCVQGVTSCLLEESTCLLDQCDEPPPCSSSLSVRMVVCGSWRKVRVCYCGVVGVFQVF